MAKLYSDEQIAKANQVNLVEYLRSEGEQFEKSGREWRWLRHDSITIRNNQWYRHRDQKGGYPIEFLRKYYGFTFIEAMKRLLTFSNHYPDAVRTVESVEPIPFVAPQKARNNQKVVDYLIQQRFIDKKIVHEFIRRKLIYEDAEYHNTVFAGYDPSGVMKHAHKRSVISDFRANVEGSLPEYCFYSAGTSEKFFVFEGPIDLLSYVTLYPQDWKQNHLLALCGLFDKALLYRLSQNPKIKVINLCLDQDQAGQQAASRMKEQLQDMNYKVQIIESKCKDWNEDLKSLNGRFAKSKHVDDRAHKFERHIHLLNSKIEDIKRRTASLSDVLSPFFHVLSYQKKSNQEISDYLLEMMSACHHLIMRVEGQNRDIEYWHHKDKGGLQQRVNRIRQCIEDLKQAYYQENNQSQLLKAQQKTMSECAHLHFELTQREEKMKMDQDKAKPKAPLIGANGNIFNLMGIASKVLKQNDRTQEADEMMNRITQNAQSYEEALRIIDEYVEIVSQDELEESIEIGWED